MVRQTRQLPYLNFHIITFTLSLPRGADYAHPLALVHLEFCLDYAPVIYRSKDHLRSAFIVFFFTLTLASRHAEGRVSKRSTSSERRPLTPTPSLKRKRRSSVSPPRKRRTSPPPTSSTKSKTSYTAVTSRSGSLGKGGDRDLRESHPRYLLFVWISVSC